MPLKAYAVKSTAEAYSKMLEVVEVLRAAQLSLPDAVLRFFLHEPIDRYERRTPLPNPYTIFLSDLPPGTLYIEIEETP